MARVQGALVVEEEVDPVRSKTKMVVLVLLVLSLIAAACGDGGGAGDDATVIRFLFAPDPAWDYIAGVGGLGRDADGVSILDKWQSENNIFIATSESWDEFTFFASGNGDIVSMGTHELPVLEAETGLKTVAFGQYNHQRVPLFRRAGDPYETLADVPPGSTICASSAVSNTIVWSVIADQLHGLDYRVGGGDFNMVVQDHFVMPELLVRGECEVAAFIPEAAIPHLRSGEIEQMYNDRQPWQVYQEVCNCDHSGILSNLMIATEEWYEAHEEEAKAFLELWQMGIEGWEANKAEIIETYPQHFAVEDPADVDFMINYMSGQNDWFVDTVYLDQGWIDEEVKFYDYMIEGGWMDADADTPRFEVVSP